MPIPWVVSHVSLYPLHNAWPLYEDICRTMCRGSTPYRFKPQKISLLHPRPCCNLFHILTSFLHHLAFSIRHQYICIYVLLVISYNDNIDCWVCSTIIKYISWPLDVFSFTCVIFLSRASKTIMAVVRCGAVYWINPVRQLGIMSLIDSISVICRVFSYFTLSSLFC